HDLLRRLPTGLRAARPVPASMRDRQGNGRAWEDRCYCAVPSRSWIDTPRAHTPSGLSLARDVGPAYVRPAKREEAPGASPHPALSVRPRIRVFLLGAARSG